MKTYIILTIGLLMASCSDFLELKPDRKMDIPSTLADCELLLNEYAVLNSSFAAANLIAGEEFYLNGEDWSSISDPDERNAYIWSDEPTINAAAWQGPYKAVFYANQILSVVEALSAQEKESQQAKEIVGNAHFFRAFAYQQLLELYCLPFNKNTAAAVLGLPLKFTPDLELPKGRASLLDTYQQIVSDYQMAADKLPLTAIARSRPNKTAAYAGLARLYLDMQDYAGAFRYADSAWKAQPNLLDYNTLDIYDEMSIPKNNAEIIFTAQTFYSETLTPYAARINPDLMALYANHDLRKLIYFQYNDFDPGTYGYKTNYDQSAIGAFIGFTSSEMLLIRAEAAARLSKKMDALADINLLRKNRFANGKFVPVDWGNDMLLSEILKERRRELVFRGRRWADTKRLNQTGVTQVVPRREVNGTNYQLVVGSPKYAFLIPRAVVDLNPTIEQNKR